MCGWTGPPWAFLEDGPLFIRWYLSALIPSFTNIDCIWSLCLGWSSMVVDNYINRSSWWDSPPDLLSNYPGEERVQVQTSRLANCWCVDVCHRSPKNTEDVWCPWCSMCGGTKSENISSKNTCVSTVPFSTSPSEDCVPSLLIITKKQMNWYIFMYIL